MSDLDAVKGLIASGDKESAISLLASLLLKDKNRLDAWLLMGDMIDNPGWKKDSYQQALKLAPNNSHALTKLQELSMEASQSLSAPAEEAATDGPPTITRKRINYIPNPEAFRPVEDSSRGGEVIWYVLGGIAGFLVLLYLIGNPENSTSDSLFIGLIFLSLIAGVIVLAVSSRNSR